jgi:hypothetical protein
MSTERCPTCGRTFANRLALGVHQARARACHDPDASRRRAREREARYRARHPERRRRQVREAHRRLRTHCPDYFRVWRDAHPTGERARRLRWRIANPDRLLAQRRRRLARRRAEIVSVPASHAHHPLFERAWDVLRAIGIRRDDHLVAIRDTRWEDACSEAVLALIEGRDPEAAVRALLSTERAFAARHLPLDHPDRLAASA